ncbi:phosphotransferase enzyme family protein [Nocardioides zeae]|uniref:Phosphotransferase n=1 Tax=Nocardioides zeae TaxID=1457234 RepID=A0A6P0HNQ8_9ACTN|nr:phosphotransferase [Nocardioides zeae]NEN79867.1 phosphotransferase [Nocardioides zeae]
MLSVEDCDEILAAALPAYGAGDAPRRLLSLSENATYLVGTGADRVVARVHRPGYQTPASIDAELAWLDRLRSSGTVTTHAVVPALDGRRVVSVPRPDGDRHVVLFTFVVGGTGEERPDALPTEELGRVTARMHRDVTDWELPDGFTRFHWDAAACLGPGARWGDWAAGPGVRATDLPVLDAAASAVRARLAAYGQGRERYGLVHADLRHANLMVGDDGSLTVIDFDDCGFGWFLYDLATVTSWIEHEPGAQATAAAWLAGYLTERPLTEEDLAMVPTFVMLRRLMLTAWLGTHPGSPPALALGTTYGAGTGDLARRYLHDPAWFRLPVPAATHRKD